SVCDGGVVDRIDPYLNRMDGGGQAIVERDVDHGESVGVGRRREGDGASAVRTGIIEHWHSGHWFVRAGDAGCECLRLVCRAGRDAGEWDRLRAGIFENVNGGDGIDGWRVVHCADLDAEGT